MNSCMIARLCYFGRKVACTNRLMPRESYYMQEKKPGEIFSYIIKGNQLHVPSLATTYTDLQYNYLPSQ
jgi:hypothetical protein